MTIVYLPITYAVLNNPPTETPETNRRIENTQKSVIHVRMMFETACVNMLINKAGFRPNLTEIKTHFCGRYTYKCL